MEKRAGTAFGTGRPSTGRTHAITIRISEKAFDYLCSVGNKSAYIDTLIINDKKDDDPFNTWHYIYYNDGIAAPFEVKRKHNLCEAKAWIAGMLKDHFIINVDDSTSLQGIEDSPLTARYEVYDGTHRDNPVYRSPYFYTDNYK